MVDFVEKARLIVEDRASKPVRKINSEIARLLKTAQKLRNTRIQITGTAAAVRDINRVTSALNKVPRSKSARIEFKATGLTGLQKQIDKLQADSQLRIETTTPGMSSALTKLREMRKLVQDIKRNRNLTVNTKTTGGATVAGAGPRRAVGPVLPSAFGVPLGSVGNTPFPGNLGAAANIATAYLTIRAAEVTIGSAVTATLEAQAAETRREAAIADPAIRAQIERAGIDATRVGQTTSLTRGENIALDLAVTGFRGDVLDALAPHIARLESAATAVNPARAEQIATLSNKIGNLAAVTEDAGRAQTLATGVYRAAILQGETFNASTAIAALRTSGTAQTIDEEGFVRFALATDELGRQVGSGIQRLNKILSTSLDAAGAGSGVSKGVVEALIAAGVRGEEGVTGERRQLLERDPLRFVEEVIGGLVREQGLDPRSTEDRAEVKALVQQMGFVGAELKLITNELSAGSERDKALALQLDPNAAFEAAQDDLGFQLKALAANFKTFSSQTLEPLFEVLAPGVAAVSDFLKELALAEGAGSQLRRVGVAAGVAAAALGTVVATTKLFNRLSPLKGSAVALNTSAANLNAAAARLGASGAVGDVGGAAGGRPRLGPSRTQLGIGALGVIGLATTNNSPEAAEFRAEQMKKGVTSAFEAVGLGGLKEFLDRRNQDLRDRAESGDVSMLRRFLQNTLVGEQLPAADPAKVAARANAELLAENGEKINTQLDVMIRNFEKINESGRSEASINSLFAQQQGRLDTIEQFGGTEQDVLQALVAEGIETSDLERVFGEGAVALNTATMEGIGDAATEFGPIAGQGILDMAGPAGSAMAEAFVNGIQGATVGTTEGRPTPRLDTGTQLPQ